MTDIKHEITLLPEKTLGEELQADCSCGQVIGIFPFPVKWAEVSAAVAEHLRPQAEAMMKELLKVISVKDIIKMIRVMRKK